MRGGGLAFAALHSCSEASSLADAASQMELASKSGSDQSLELLTSPALGSPNQASLLGSGAADAGQTQPLILPDAGQAAVCASHTPLYITVCPCGVAAAHTAWHLQSPASEVCQWSCCQRRCTDGLNLRSGHGLSLRLLAMHMRLLALHGLLRTGSIYLHCPSQA